MQLDREEYLSAQKLGKKEYNERLAAGKNPEPLVLDEILPEADTLPVRELGVIEIPVDRIVGVKSAGRSGAFSAGFLPLMGADSEFAMKWVNLCAAHLSETGIEQPIQCYEYLGRFYVTEGNKRVSVLRYFGAARIPAMVKRLMPVQTDAPEIRAYYEFLEFYQLTKLYAVRFRRPKDYERLLVLLGKDSETVWTEDERRAFRSRFCLFREAVEAVNVRGDDILPEEVLLLWLELYSYDGMGQMTTTELKKSVADLWNDALSARKASVQVEAKVEESKPNLISRILPTTPSHLNIAFIQQLDPSGSGWAKGHEQGMEELRKAMGNKIAVRSYYNVNTETEADTCLDHAVEQGAQVVFTTVPQMNLPTLRAAVRHPKVQFFNCSVGSAFSSIRTYYGRIFEAKFITGAIAGAMAENDRIGYIASYPIYGVPASINAFALGAAMTNPRARIELRWGCVEGSPQADFFASGIRVISNRDVPVQSKTYLDFCNYGTYRLDEKGELEPLASPVWAWGRFYEQAVRGILTGSVKNERSATAKNYWLGMDTGVIDVELSDKLPEGVRRLALMLKQAIIAGELPIFAGELTDQDGNCRRPEGERFSMEELMRMDWLCKNVCGSIPTYDQLLPSARDIVRELGLHKDQIPLRKEEKA